MRTWLLRQNAWTRGLVSTVLFGLLTALVSSLSSKHGAILVPTIVSTVLWGVLFTGYLVWRERRDGAKA